MKNDKRTKWMARETMSDMTCHSTGDLNPPGYAFAATVVGRYRRILDATGSAGQSRSGFHCGEACGYPWS